MNIFLLSRNHILKGYFLVALLTVFSCVKESKPPDCTKPPAPTVKRSITVNEGDSIHLTASGVNGASYSWSGPNKFYSTGANPVIANASIIHNGIYWARQQSGYCFSDSSATEVFVKTDTTCRLSDNGADFPNGGRGLFTIFTTCSTNTAGAYIIHASNADSSILIDAAFKQKPVHGGQYFLTDSQNPAENEVYFRVTSTFLGSEFYSKGSLAYVKVGSNKVNLVVCMVSFKNLGVFSANIACN
jgi:hypothetical protein